MHSSDFRVDSHIISSDNNKVEVRNLYLTRHSIFLSLVGPSVMVRVQFDSIIQRNNEEKLTFK